MTLRGNDCQDRFRSENVQCILPGMIQAAMRALIERARDAGADLALFSCHALRIESVHGIQPHLRLGRASKAARCRCPPGPALVELPFYGGNQDTFSCVRWAALSRPAAEHRFYARSAPHPNRPVPAGVDKLCIATEWPPSMPPWNWHQRIRVPLMWRCTIRGREVLDLAWTRVRHCFIRSPRSHPPAPSRSSG